MKAFKSIREYNNGNTVEINDVPEDPLSYVEIKPKKSKADKKEVDMNESPLENIVQKVKTVKRHMVAKSRAKKLFSASRDASNQGDFKTAAAQMDKSKRYSNIAQGMKEEMTDSDKSSVALQAMVAKKKLQQTAGKNKSQAFVDKMVSKANAGDRLPRRPSDEYDRKVTSYLKKKYNEETNMFNNEETVVETKGAPKGFHFTRDGKLKRGDANVDGPGGPKLRSDPLDKLRSKVPPVSEASMDNLMHKVGDSVTVVSKFFGKQKGKVTKIDSKSYHVQRHNKDFSERFPHSAVIKEEAEQMDEKLTSKDIKMAVGVAKDKRYAGGNMSGAVKAMEKMKPGLSKHPRVQQVLKSTQEGVDFLKIWESIKSVDEEVKTTHEDPLVVTKDAEGNIHTHANLSVANAIHGTDVKHQAIHTGKPVQAGNFTFELSMHHAGALKEQASFDPVAHKKELDRLMTKHMSAHAETSKLIKAKAPQEDINKAQERNNAIKAQIRAHKDKVPKGPAPKPGSAADYYASKKPGEYTGD